MNKVTIVKEGERWIARFAFSWETKDAVKAAGFTFSPNEKLWFTRDEATARRLDPQTAAQAVAEANMAIAQSRATEAQVAIPAPVGQAYLPYQVAGITYARTRRNVLIADEMGLGKTIQAIGVINCEPSIRNVLVVCPASIKVNWARELNKWLVTPFEILIGQGKPDPEFSQRLIRLCSFNDQIRAEGSQNVVDQMPSTNLPKVKGFSGNNEEAGRFLNSRTPAEVGNKPINQSTIGLGNGQEPHPVASRPGNAPLSINNPGSVGQNSHVLRGNVADRLPTSTSLRHVALIINYDVLLAYRPIIDQINWDLLIVDECHKVKNQKAQRTRALLGHTDRHNPAKNDPGVATKRRVFMTGTPIVNRPAELWTTVHALDENDLGRSFFNFMKRYTNAVHNGYGWDFSGASNLVELQQKLRSKFMVRRLKADVLSELPAKRRQIIELSPAGCEQVILAERNAFERNEVAVREATAERARAHEAGDKEAFEAAVRKLKQARKVAFEEMSKLRRKTAVAKIPQVIAHLEDCLEDSEGKVVVFAHHHEVANALRHAFPTAAVVTGETTIGQRQLEVDKFQLDPDCRVFIGSIQAAGVGFTLTASAHVVFAELDWVPGNVSQAEDRCHRIGQKQSVLVQHLVFDDSVDSRMAHMIVEKQTVIDAALDNATGKVELSATQQSLNEAQEPPRGVDVVVPDSDEIPF